MSVLLIILYTLTILLHQKNAVTTSKPVYLFFCYHIKIWYKKCLRKCQIYYFLNQYIGKYLSVLMSKDLSKFLCWKCLKSWHESNCFQADDLRNFIDFLSWADYIPNNPKSGMIPKSGMFPIWTTPKTVFWTTPILGCRT